MEQEFNPYVTGQIHQPHADPSVGITVTPMALDAIIKTKFWVKFVGGIMVVISVLTFIGGVFSVGNAGVMSGAFNVAIGVTLLVSIAYIIMAVRLLQYGGAIQKLSISENAGDLSKAMEMQSKFWKLAGGIMTAIIMLYLFMMVFTVSSLAKSY